MTFDSKPSHQFLEKLVQAGRQFFIEDRKLMAFDEYFRMVMDNPRSQLRSSSQYLIDTMKYFGQSEKNWSIGRFMRFHLFDTPFANGEGRVSGQEGVQEAMFRLLDNFAREGRINKLVLLHGPNGSAKSSLVRCLMSGMEAYSRLSEGALYSFNWIFPTEKLKSSHIGFSAAEKRANYTGNSYAYLPADLIDARVPCEMHDHPVFLIPQPMRNELLTTVLPAASSEQKSTSPCQTSAADYLRFGDLCYKCRRIYDALLASYDGDMAEVLKHIQIERFYISRRYRRGVASIEPQMSVDARIQQVTADRSLQSLPKALHHISLYEPSGPLVDANRGLLEFSDLLKRPVETFKYLLDTAETATVSIDSFVLHLDVVFIASTNETYLDAFKEHPDFPSFKGRMELIKVPYILRYQDEKNIYESQITSRVVGRHIAPHAIDVASLWAVLTRMRSCEVSQYPKEIEKVIVALKPLEKLRLYNEGEIPDHLSIQEAKELLHQLPRMYKESLGQPHYEGRIGASAREIRTALLNAAHYDDYACLCPLAVFSEIRELLNAKTEYDFLKQEKKGDYHDHQDFLKQSEALYLRWIDSEVRESMGLTTEDSYKQLFDRYIMHVSHWVKGEKINDATSDVMQDPDEKFMKEIEAILKSKEEKAADFRRAVIGTIGAYSLEHPEQSPNYLDLFTNYVDRLREDFYAKRRKILKRLIGNFLKYTSDERKQLEPKEQKQALAMLDYMKSHFDYCENCARDTVAYLMKHKYEAD